MLFFAHDTTSPYFNLALEEALLRECKDDIFMLWRNSPVVVIGRHQEITQEVNCTLANQMQIPIIRRITGGGAVFHDLGTVNFTFITGMNITAEDLLKPVIANSGLDAACSDRNDVLVDGLKIAGTAQYIVGGRRLFHGSLLFDTDLEILSNILTPRHDKLARHGVSSVRGRVTNIKPRLHQEMTTEQYEAMLERCIIRDMGLKQSAIAQRYIDMAHELADSKYRSDEWTFRKLVSEGNKHDL